MDECRQQYGANSDMDYPPMLALSWPTPFGMEVELGDRTLPRAIQKGLQRIAGYAVALIAMPCNTAHLYYDELAASVDVPLLHIVDETIQRLPEDVARVAVLATRYTLDGQLSTGAGPKQAWLSG